MAGHSRYRHGASYERRWAKLVEAICAEVDRYSRLDSDREHEAATRRARLLEARARALTSELRGRWRGSPARRFGGG